MVVSQTAQEIRSEYREYLNQEHPEWSENTVKTHVSDAFYIWNNTLVGSFWDCLVSDTAMQEAKKEIYDYLKNDVMSDKAEQRTEGYYADLCMLKKYIDERYGSIRERVGQELDADEILYNYSRQVYEGKLDIQEAVQQLADRISYFSATSLKMTIMLFACMMDGKDYKRRGNTSITLYFIRKIGEDFGEAAYKNALQATKNNVLYYYQKTGNRSNSILRGCRKLLAQRMADISFGDEMFDGIIPEQTTDDALVESQEVVRYWLYSAGDNSANWEKDYAEGIMAIGWDELEDLSQYNTKDEIRNRLQEIRGTESSFKNQVHAVWQFVNDIKIGDIIIVKQGMSKVIGKGTVSSDYIYDETREAYRNIRQVNWTDKGEWEHPGQAAMKTLTDITGYTEYVKKLLALFLETAADQDEPEYAYEPYSKVEFLEDVYLSEKQYDILCRLLLTKKNIILQGAPGVGKTFAAKRLAFSIMGEKDTNRVKMVQFHQSYSYEDFIMGFRPKENGFELKNGVFYEFCKQAEEDDRPYFFIIDEINRGNLSKIFGEIFMLLENDKRGVELQLLYKDEQFAIPNNVYIIGMMNTADRSLAMLDYALRRRFAFYEFAPAFQSAGFRAYRAKAGNPKFDKLIQVVEKLNEAISADESLGDGFRIGHSYFCTKTSINEEWMQSVVEFELIPLLKEYWFDEPVKVKDWSENLRCAIR